MTFKQSFAIAAILALPTACVVDDADLQNAGITEFSLAPASTATNVFAMDLSGSVSFGYSSPEDATLEILVDGVSVHQQSIPTDALTATIQASVPLRREGTNEVIGVLRYYGAELTQRFTVDVAMDAPSLAFGAWTTDYVANEGLTASASLTPSVAGVYQIDDVSFSENRAAWTAATDNGNGTWQIEIANPDIGSSVVSARVTASYDGHTITTVTDDVLGISPIFDCNTPAQSMLPTSTLRRDMSYENRVMSGYFGKPDSGHDIAFVITARDDNNRVFDSVGENISRGNAAINTKFAVNRFRCVNNPCSQTYALALYVDGVQHCANSSFGEVWEY